MKTESFYGPDLARIHSEGYAQLSVKAAAWMAAQLAARQLQEGTIIDLGCGAGQLLEILAQAGYRTIGLDLSSDLLALAQKHSPQSQLLHQSIWDYEFEPCIAVSAIGEIITYNFDGKNSLDNLRKLFQRIYQKLAPGGLLLFDYLEPNIIVEGDHMVKLVRREEWFMAVEYHEDKVAKTFQRDITVFQQTESGLYRQSREIHPICLFDRIDIQNMLHEIGFQTTWMTAYQDLALRPKHLAVCCWK